jgi:hypothetical protein
MSNNVGKAGKKVASALRTHAKNDVDIVAQITNIIKTGSKDTRQTVANYDHKIQIRAYKMLQQQKPANHTSLHRRAIRDIGRSLGCCCCWSQTQPF